MVALNHLGLPPKKSLVISVVILVAVPDKELVLHSLPTIAKHVALLSTFLPITVPFLVEATMNLFY